VLWRLAAGVDCAPHQRRGRLERTAPVVVGYVAQPAPGRQSRAPEYLRHPHVADSGNKRLVEHDLAEPARTIGATDPRKHRLDSGRPGEDVGPEAAQRTGVELEYRAVPQHGFVALTAQHEPWTAHLRLSSRSYRPPTGHPQVRAEHHTAVEMEDEILTQRLDGLEPASAQPFGDPLRLGLGVRRLDLERLAYEDLQAAGHAVKGVALGHVSRVTGAVEDRRRFRRSSVVPTLNIAALARRTGVPADTLRKWERRYGVLAPERTPGGQRRYCDRDVARVEWLKARLAEGYRIREAAALLGVAADTAAVTPAEVREAMLDAVARDDLPGLSRLVAQVLILNVVEEALLEVLTPVLDAIGERWEEGELSVAQEHLASSVVRAHLERLLADVGGGVRGTAVLACAPGERHELGLLMFGVLLGADGWQVAYLGPDTPLQDAVALAEHTDARVLCVSATMRDSADRMCSELAATEVPKRIAVIVGGRAVGRDAATGLRVRRGSGDLRRTVGELRKLEH
jgi:methanogenic corrinoid protein MtbC1